MESGGKVWNTARMELRKGDKDMSGDAEIE
jgi:hypothetical protein